jgi:hypothetical protein
MGLWDSYSYVCALGARFNFEAAPELLDSFSHTHDANANRPSSRRVIEYSIRYPVTFVADLYCNAREILFNLDPGLDGSRMEVNVRETGLHDAEDRKFGFFRQPAQIFRYFHFHMQTPALVKSAHVALECRVQCS